MYRRYKSITVSALAAGAQETLTIADAELGHAKFGDRYPDVVVVNPVSAPEAGFAILHAYVSANGVISVTVANIGASPLTGGALQVSIGMIR